MARCSRIVGIYLTARRASGLPLSSCAIAFLMFCVLGLPWQALTKASFAEITTNPSVIRSTPERFNDLASACPTRSNPISASRPALRL